MSAYDPKADIPSMPRCDAPMAARAVARCGALSAAIDHKPKTRKHNLFSRFMEAVPN
jgi:hypothetical protein